MTLVHGGVKFYRGAPSAARNYVEADRSRVDDYYLVEGSGLAELIVAINPGAEGVDLDPVLLEAGVLDADAYEAWVAGLDAEGNPKGRLRTDEHGLRFVEVVVNGPKTWSVAASLHPEIGAALDRAQDRAAREIVTWLALNATTRIGPRGRQVQMPVARLEAAVVRHFTSRAGDPHRHLHLQINARVLAAGKWRGLHSVGVVDSIEALNGIGHAAVMCDPQFRRVLARHGYTLDPVSGEITQLQPYAQAFSHRAQQIARNVGRYEAEWRQANPGREPDAKIRRTWDRRAWAESRPDKVIPRDGQQLAQRWREELFELGFRPPENTQQTPDTAIGSLDRDAVVDLVQARLGTRRSSWNAGDIRGEVEKIIASIDFIAEPAVRRELAEDLTARTVANCVPLLNRDDVPGHVRAFTSAAVLDVENDILDRLVRRSDPPDRVVIPDTIVTRRRLDAGQRAVVAALIGDGKLVVAEGPAGAGKTSTLVTAESLLRHHSGARLLVATPTLKAAQAVNETGVPAVSASWIVHEHGFRWDDDGHWDRVPQDQRRPSWQAQLRSGDLLVIDEAGMLDQDTARALLIVADEAGARVAFIGDRHQLPAVGRGGVLDHAARWAPPECQATLETVHRFTDPDYADLSLKMRTGEAPEHVFDALMDRGNIVIHASEAERTAALAEAGHRGETVIADKLDSVAHLNATIQERHHDRNHRDAQPVARGASGPLFIGDRVATRRNDRNLDVANRDTWTITAADDRGNLTVRNGARTRELPADYIRENVELAYATTVHGAQGETVDHAHFALDETSSAASAYVALTRGRRHNTAHLVADDTTVARDQWAAAFSHTRLDLGPSHAREQAATDIDCYGPNHVPARHTLYEPTSARGRERGPVVGR